MSDHSLNTQMDHFTIPRHGIMAISVNILPLECKERETFQFNRINAQKVKYSSIAVAF